MSVGQGTVSSVGEGQGNSAIITNPGAGWPDGEGDSVVWTKANDAQSPKVNENWNIKWESVSQGYVLDSKVK